MTVGEFRKATQHLPDSTEMLYAWTWRSPEILSIGRYCGFSGSPECLLFDASWNSKLHPDNTIIWKDSGEI